MCGIAGIQYISDRRVDPSEIDRMASVIVHRGPDKYRQWISEDGRTGFGHQRLSIIDLSELADQPMHYLDRYVITFNGEIYNYVELRKELQEMGYTFSSHTDTEVVPAAWDAWREACLERFEGMFAFALYDRLEKRLFCARDRFGEKPFFYQHIPGKHFIFGSEIKVLLNWLPEYQLDKEMFFLFLTYDLHENPRNRKQTFFQGISRLEAAHYLILEADGSLQMKRYWEIKAQAIPRSLSICDASDQFCFLLERSVERRLRSDVPVGTSLSGGLDSGTLAHIILQKNHNNPHQFKSFTARFNSLSKDEGHFVKRLSDQYTFTSYQTLVNEFVLLNDLDRLVWHQEQPIASASPVAQWEVMKLAHRHKMKVLLDGQGADETLAGYTHYFRPYFKELIFHQFGSFLREYRFFKRNQQDQNIFGYDFLLELFMPDLRRKLARIKRNLALPGHMADLGPELVNQFRHYEPPFTGIKNLQSSLHSSTFNYGLEKLLSFADRNSMAFSLEVRLPYLDHSLVEFIFSLPSDMKLNQGWTKYILRLAYSERIPAEISWRKDKLGYEPPQASWMKNPFIRQKTTEAIRSLQQKGFIGNPNPAKTWNYLISDVFLRAYFPNL